MAERAIDEQLVKYLTDVHAIEEQALVQLRTAPEIAADAELRKAFERHLDETEDQKQRLRERLAAHDASPSTPKDLVGKAGGQGMLLFARSQPDTPGKLTAHAFSYEHLEIAAYELLRRIAERAGDAGTVSVAREIGEQERRMANRLERLFDRATDASLRPVAPGELDSQLDSYMADAHAIEMQEIELLGRASEATHEAGLEKLYEEHLHETRHHEARLRDQLERRGTGRSRLKDAAMRLGGLNWGAFFQAQPDTPAKLAGFAFTFQHLEIAAYELLRRVAERVDDGEAIRTSASIAADERSAASRIEAEWDRALEASLLDQGVEV